MSERIMFVYVLKSTFHSCALERWSSDGRVALICRFVIAFLCFPVAGCRRLHTGFGFTRLASPGKDGSMTEVLHYTAVLRIRYTGTAQSVNPSSTPVTFQRMLTCGDDFTTNFTVSVACIKFHLKVYLYGLSQNSSTALTVCSYTVLSN